MFTFKDYIYEIDKEKSFTAADITPRVKLELDQLKTCYELSCKGLGVSFVTDTLIKNAGNDSGAYFKIASPYAKRTLCIAHKKNTYISKGMERFIALTTELLH